MSDPAGSFPTAGDPDAMAARDPGTAPAQLADIAARRWDLHPLVSMHPRAYPELRSWIAQVNPDGAQAPWIGSPAPAPVRRRGRGWWFAGCGCLVLVAVVIIGVVLLGGLGAALSSGDGDSRRDDAGTPATQVPGDEAVGNDPLAVFESEREAYDALAAQLDGNPAAPLVLKQDVFRRLEERAEDPNLTEFSAETLAQQARQLREQVQQSIAAAETRRGNSSGTLTEDIVDKAGAGFIDIRWDAASACPVSGEEGWRTSACVTKEDSLTVHLLPEKEYSSDWEKRMLVVHELAHVYQRADGARFEDRHGRADELVDQGLFEGDFEKMADCYALTYHDQWSLSRGNLEIGYGYVCGEAERQAIREWAADVDAPLPG
ncbi:hypothetical protein [Microbacterium sp. NPDC058345]|uniref:variant leucine-rich repeat-containing protein n=1 Tax=Microbacterium sp. NPDC058345 TaxID=3346455 RepID=UPI003657B8FD